MISVEKLHKMGTARFLLPHPGDRIVGELIEEVLRLREALDSIVKIPHEFDSDWYEIEEARRIAKRALGIEEDDKPKIKVTPTNNQIAKVMLLHGTPEQQKEALEYCKKSCNR